MKSYLVSPNLAAKDDRAARDAQLRACIAPIAGLIADSIGEDPGLLGLWHRDEVSARATEPELRFGPIMAVRLPDREALLAALIASGDPFEGRWMLIRSMATCRAVSYGFDGQALVCLRTEDRPILSPDPDLIIVEECSRMLLETDWMDGFETV